MVLILERLAELNHLMGEDRTQFDGHLIIAITLAIMMVYHRFTLVDYPKKLIPKKLIWITILVSSIVAVVTFFLAPQELRWYAVALGLLSAIFGITTFNIMRWLLKAAVRKGKRLGKIVYAVSMILFLFVIVPIVIRRSPPALEELADAFLHGMQQGMLLSMYFILDHPAKNANVKAGDAGNVGEASDVVDVEGACNASHVGELCDSDGTDPVN